MGQLFHWVQEWQQAQFPPLEDRAGQTQQKKRAEVQRKSKIVVPIYLPFDQAVTSIVKQKGDVHQSKWNPDVWDEVSTTIVNTVDPMLDQVRKHNAEASVSGLGPPAHVVWDPVVLGNLNKGREAAKILGNRMDVRTWGIVSDPENKSRAATIRRALTQPGLSPEAVEKILLGEGIIYDGDFGKVPALMARMATPELMSQSDMQVEEQIDTLIDTGIIDPELYPLPQEVEQKIIDNSPFDRVDDKLSYYRRRFPHMLYVLRTQLGIPQLRCDVLFNIHFRDQYINWYQRDLEAGLQSRAAA